MSIVRRIRTLLFGTNREIYPKLKEWMAGREIVFKAPPLTTELLKAIRLITPDYRLRLNDDSHNLWELDQNASCWAEYDTLAPLLKPLHPPSRILEIGPGLGRSVIFLSKKLKWTNAEFDLFEGNGKKTRYTIGGPRFRDSFCGNIPQLKEVLEYNGISSYRVLEADKFNYSFRNLQSKYDLIYSLYAVGFHWSLEHFLEEIASLMHDRSIAFFTVPSNFVPFDKLKDFLFKIFPSTRLPGEPSNLLVLQRRITE